MTTLGRTLAGKVAVVTGAGRGIGRAHAIALANAGAAIVVNDLGVATDGTGRNSEPADEVVATIVRGGGRAIVDTTDVSDWGAAKSIVDTAVSAFGSLDIMINNAAISRFSGAIDAISHEDWLRTLTVNLHGTAALTHWASAQWRSEGIRPGRAIVNTVSPVGLLMTTSAQLPNAAYAASKAGIAALTLACAAELAELEVRVNAIAPVARSRISKFVAPELMKPVPEGFDRMGPENIAAVVAWLASPACRFTGRIFGIKGDELTILNGWSITEQFSNDHAMWTPAALDAALAHVK